MYVTYICIYIYIIIFKYIKLYIILYNYIYISDTERGTVSLCVFGMFVSYIFIQQIV